MNGNQQSALAALKSVEPIALRLDGSRSAEDRAADILELWQGTETSLRALMGGSQLSGQGLIRELRQRELDARTVGVVVVGTVEREGLALRRVSLIVE